MLSLVCHACLCHVPKQSEDGNLLGNDQTFETVIFYKKKIYIYINFFFQRLDFHKGGYCFIIFSTLFSLLFNSDLVQISLKAWRVVIDVQYRNMNSQVCVYG